MKDLELVVVDMAGTSLADDGQVPLAFNNAFEEHGIAITAEQVNNVRGLSKRIAIQNLVPQGPDRARLGENVYATFCGRLEQQYTAKGVRAVPGAAELFIWLRTQGIRVALNTGFDRRITDLIISALKWDVDTVDVVVSGDEVSQGRPAPYLIFHAMEATGVQNVHKVANVGDTILDLRAGYNAGVRWNVGVLSGAHSREKLEMEPHTHLLQSVANLPDLFSSAAE